VLILASILALILTLILARNDQKTTGMTADSNVPLDATCDSAIFSEMLEASFQFAVERSRSCLQLTFAIQMNPQRATLISGKVWKVNCSQVTDDSITKYVTNPMKLFPITDAFQ